MPSSTKNPFYRRYLKARVRPLKQPSFWISAAGLSLAVLAAWQYWNEPEWFEANWNKFVASLNQPTTEPSLSSQELAARMADIDSSSVLLAEADRANLLPLPVQSNPNSRTQNSQGTATSLTPQPSQANSTLDLTRSSLLGAPQPNQNATNPLGVSAPSSLNIGSLSSGGLLTNPAPSREPSSTTAAVATDPLLGFNSLAYLNTNRSAAPVSALQEAVNRASAAKSPTPTVNNSAQMPASIQSQGLPASAYQGQVTPLPATVPSSSGYTTPGQFVPPAATVPSSSPYNAAGQLVTPPTVPAAPSNLVPPAPVINSGVPSVAPVTPSAVGQYPSQVPNPTYGVPNPAVNSTPRTPRLQPSQLNRSGL